MVLEKMEKEEAGMTNIIGVKAREILDSRGNPTVEVEVHLWGGRRGKRLFLPGLLPERGKHWSCGMVTQSVSWVRVCKRR